MSASRSSVLYPLESSCPLKTQKGTGKPSWWTPEFSTLRRLRAKNPTPLGYLRKGSGNWAMSSKESLRLLLDAHFPLNPSKEEERYTASDRGLLTLLNRSSLQDPTALYLHSFSVQQRYHAVDCHIYANCVRLGHIPATWRQVRVAFRNLGAGKSSYDTVKALDLSVSPSFYWKF